MNLSSFRRLVALIFAILFAPIVAAQQIDIESLSVPEGFEISLAVAPGLTAYPMFMTFDDQGNLFIAESTGKDLSGKEMVAAPECQILRLIDTDADGVFDTRTIFATDLTLPMGLAWYRDSLYVASPPDFLRFDDLDNDGIADHREVLLTGWNMLNTASLHGPFLGPDGRFYLTHGRHGYNIKSKEGKVFEGMAARIWRCWPDGTGLERYAGGGFDNPIELTFTDTGQMLGTMTYFRDPQYGQRDALLHYAWGGVYPKPHSVTSEFVQTGDLMPVMSKFARIAPSGLLQYQSDALGSHFRNGLFSAQFNPHRIQHHQLIEDGATFRTNDEDFLTSTSADFYPTDVLEDGDGSLLVCDTGAWYVDACPISRVAKPNITGSIYRVRRIGQEKVSDAFGNTIDWENSEPSALTALLSDPRFRVRERALHALVRTGDASRHALETILDSSDNESVRRLALTALRQLKGSTESIRAALDDEALSVRIAAIQAVADSKDLQTSQHLVQMLKSEIPLERREAATTLGRLGDVSSTTALLEACTKASDRFEEHALIYALIELGNTKELLTSLGSNTPWPARRAALVALDQLNDSELDSRHVLPFLQANDVSDRHTGLWVASHHPEWGPEVLAYVRNQLREGSLKEATSQAYSEILLAYAPTDAGKDFLASEANNSEYSTGVRLFLLTTMKNASVTPFPSSWLNVIEECIHAPDPAIRWQALDLIRYNGLASFDAQLANISDDPNNDLSLRLTALSSMIVRIDELSEVRRKLILSGLAPDLQTETRRAAARLLTKAPLDRTVKKTVAESFLPTADALVLEPILQLFQAESSESLGVALIEGLEANESIDNLLTRAQLDVTLRDFPASIQRQATTLGNRLEQRDENLLRRFTTLEPRVDSGDVGRGRALFFGETLACSTCHAIGEEGGTLGPDLTTIGLVRSGHDLLEAILFPSASIVPDYASYTVTTSTEELSGILRTETPEFVTLDIGVGDTRRIPKSEITEMTPLVISTMPDGLDASLTDDELIDVVTFLRSLNNEQWLLPRTRN